MQRGLWPTEVQSFDPHIRCHPRLGRSYTRSWSLAPSDCWSLQAGKVTMTSTPPWGGEIMLMVPPAASTACFARGNPKPRLLLLVLVVAPILKLRSICSDV